ncbi:hypothetical protein [Chamaesiphon sp.]|uniref:hypothetical protein n=1 Tax=Chamaesiphon sp. TaxID=2814140 RepID=UPI00359474F9
MLKTISLTVPKLFPTQNSTPHGTKPTSPPTLSQEITKLHTPKQIQIVWLTTTDNIPDARPPQSKRT